MKAYIVEVRKTAKGPQIVVSRTHPGLVKRLFELEVPELVDGVVEIKAVAREPGHRTKLAVASNDQQRRPGRRVRRRARHARAPGRQRAARREGRHRSLQRRPARVRDARARAGEGARGAHPRGHRHRRGHRPRLPAVARDRQGRPERAPRRAAHRLARRHQERDPARGRGVGRRLYAEGEWVKNDGGELVWQPAEGGEAISAAEAGYAAPDPARRPSAAAAPTAPDGARRRRREADVAATSRRPMRTRRRPRQTSQPSAGRRPRARPRPAAATSAAVADAAEQRSEACDRTRRQLSDSADRTPHLRRAAAASARPAGARADRRGARRHGVGRRRSRGGARGSAPPPLPSASSRRCGRRALEQGAPHTAVETVELACAYAAKLVDSR